MTQHILPVYILPSVHTGLFQTCVCPLTDQFNQMCPSGRGFIPNGDLLYGVPTSDVYRGKTSLQPLHVMHINLTQIIFSQS